MTTPDQLTRTELQDNIRDMIPDNNDFEVSPQDIRRNLLNMSESLAIRGEAPGTGSLNFSDLVGQIADSQIPDAIMRDSEFTAAAIREMLLLTSDEVNGIVTGSVVSGNTLTITRNDGTTVTFTVTGGSGADGVVASGAFSADYTELILDSR